MRTMRRGKAARKIGLPPGSLVHVGERRAEEVRIALMDYDERDLREKDAASLEDCRAAKDDTESVSWINISGIHDTDVIKRLGDAFKIHSLVLEDILNTDHRPKMEDYDDYLYLVLKVLRHDPLNDEILVEQVSLILGPHFVISFQEAEGEVFNPIRERLRQGKGRIRKMGTDYLAYALMDAVVDHYFVILEKIGERIEDLQAEVLSDPNPETLQTIQITKREMIFLRKSIWPLREAVNALLRGESSLVTDPVMPFLRDIYDHTIHVIDSIETFRDLISGTLDVYLSSVSNKMNQVMKVLTIIATIFIPLTFIAGIYGMNFEYMPELKWRWAYLRPG